MAKIGNQGFYHFRILLIVAILFSFLLSWAQEVTSVQASVDNDHVAVGGKLVLTIAIISNESPDIVEPRPPNLEGFVLSNSWTSSAISKRMVPTDKGMQWMSQNRKEFSYELQAQEAGQFQIPSFEVNVGNKLYRTEPILITVSNQQPPGRSQQPPRGRPSLPGMPDMDEIDKMEEELFNQMLQQRQRFFRNPGGPSNPSEPSSRHIPNINPNEAFFVHVDLDKTEVYEGEQITATWYIYTRGQMETLDRVKFPSLRGFWKETIEEVPVIQFTEELVNNIPYRKALLASHALFPIKAGTATIDEYKIKSRVRLANQGYGFGFGKAYEYTRSSKPISIKVKSLPTEDRPANFSGAVGQFEMNAKLEQKNFVANQPFSFKVRFDGSGNAKMIELPAMSWPSGLEVYDTKSDSKFFKDGRSYKEFEILVIPRQEGVLKIPALSIGFFDPKEKKYYQKSSSEIEINVTASANTPANAEARISGTSTNNESHSAALPSVLMGVETAGLAQTLTHNWSFWALMFLGLFVGFFLRLRKVLGWSDKKKNLAQKLHARIKKLEKDIQKKDHRKLGAELTNVTYFLLGELSGEGGGTTELDKLLDKAPPSLRRELGAEIKTKFEIFQTLSFAPEEVLGKLKSWDELNKLVGESKVLFQKMLSYSNEEETTK